MKIKFNLGDRIRIVIANGDYKAFDCLLKYEGNTGTVLAYSSYEFGIYRILLDGRSNPEDWHESFLEKI